VVLTVYVDDILLTDSDSVRLLKTKQYLKCHFVTKDMGRPKYFLRIESCTSKARYTSFPAMYTLNLLEEAGLLGCKPATTPMKVNVNLWFDDSHALDDPERYRRLTEKLIYLTVIRSDITFTVGVQSRFMHQPRKTHWLAAIRVFAYIKSCPGKKLVYKKHEHVRIFLYSDSGYAGDRGDMKFTIGYCTFVGENLKTWRSKQQDVVSRLSAEAEYRVIAHTIWEIVWLKKIS